MTNLPADQQVKRFDLVTSYPCGEPWNEIEERQDGDYVLWSDYERLRNENAALKLVMYGTPENPNSFANEQLKRRQAEHELDDALAKLQELDVLLRRTTPYLHGTELRDQIYAALPEQPTRTAPP
jgi:hypothetical protein